ncbi:MAG: ferredoxin family protein [Nitrososphaerota archaeon]|nr:ferredoxin family protein [Nitrososphaerota archaeon]
MVSVIDREKCIGCLICQLACPGDIIRLHRNTKLAIVEHPEECWNCGFCVHDCPTDAISISFNDLT